MRACAVVFLMGLTVANCESGESGGKQAPGELVASSLARDLAPPASAADVEQLSRDNARFAWQLYRALRAERGNVVLSPYSISTALGMTYAGARGETETEMAGALELTLPQAALHPAFNRLDLDLASRGSSGFVLETVNQLFGQTGYDFVPEFLDTLATSYGAGLRTLDFAADPEGARQRINRWVFAATAERIRDLLPEGVLDDDARLVLVNAITLDAIWARKFEPGRTAKADFELLEGGTTQVDMMRQTLTAPYVRSDGFEAVELAYEGEAQSMLLIVPDAGGFGAVEGALDAALVEDVVARLTPTELELGLPRFEFETPLPLVQGLESRGMRLAFTELANFSGISTREQLMIYDVRHQAFIAVDEEGTRAAAATGVIVGPTSAPVTEVRLTIDRPFVFAIRDRQSGAVLFLGRVLDPAAS